MFLLRDKGGVDDAPPSPNRLYETYRREQVPLSLLVTLPGLQGVDLQIVQIVNDRLFNTNGGIYIGSFIESPNPRESIQRGRFQDAIRELTVKRDNFGKYKEIIRNNPNADKEIKEWCQRAQVLYANKANTVLIADSATKASAEAEALTAIEKHWRDDGGPLSLVISRVSIPVCDAEAAFLLALCKHEMAERKQTQADYAKGEDAARLEEDAIEAWSDSLKAWGTYMDVSEPQIGIPGRIEEANAMRDRAAKFAHKK
jgi:hypothetical protein